MWHTPGAGLNGVKSASHLIHNIASHYKARQGPHDLPPEREGRTTAYLHGPRASCLARSRGCVHGRLARKSGSSQSCSCAQSGHAGSGAGWSTHLQMWARVEVGGTGVRHCRHTTAIVCLQLLCNPGPSCNPSYYATSATSAITSPRCSQSNVWDCSSRDVPRAMCDRG